MLCCTRMALIGAALSFSPLSWAASCCGGGSASSLILPKFSEAMIDVSTDMEFYNGYWNAQGDYHEDPQGSDLRQYRLNFGYAQRLASRWQASVIMPYVWNRSEYAGISSNTEGVGDTTLNLFYEAFDGIKCVWKVRDWKDLVPAVYYGMSLTVPTGISPYDDVDNSFDVTGRGFYRVDSTLVLDKTIYPWNVSMVFSYGKYLERDVNRKYGQYVEPYTQTLGDRFLQTYSLGYTSFLENMSTLTYTLAFSYLQEEAGEIDGRSDPTTKIGKNSSSITMAYASMDRDWVYKFTWSHAEPKDGMGENFTVTDVYTVGVSYVLR